MAMAFIIDALGCDAEDYEAVMEHLQLGGRLPEGALIHAAGPTDEGWRACDVWEDPEAFARFGETRMAPAFAARGLQPPRITSFPVHEIRRGAPAPVGHVQVVRLGPLDAERFVELDKQIVGEDRSVPAGCVFHVNGELDGQWVVLDYWTSKDVRDRFIADRVAPVMQAAGVPAPPIEDLAVHNAITEQAAHA